MNEHKKTIKLLPPELANQIAAGEVVERPSSVLKELVENSLDAEATSIHAHVEDGGQTSIKVSDDGKGIPKEELTLAVTRHATSKINTIGDLSSILSFGFRGEALPSIASVSRFRISSVSKYSYPNSDDCQAHSLEVVFGEHQPIQPTSLQKGTQIEVRDLFNNIPARLKFLKTPATELKRAQEIFTRIGLIHLDKSFSFHAGSREALSFLKQDSLHQRLCKIWTPSITSDMLEVDMTVYDDIHVQGLISNPRSLYAKSDKILLYVNKRPVSDKVLVRAIRQAYQNSLTSRDFPQVLLDITINPEEVDVNVHPAKSEVRFRDEQRIFKAVYVALEKTLAKKLFFAEEKINAASQSTYTIFDDMPPHYPTNTQSFPTQQAYNREVNISQSFENTKEMFENNDLHQRDASAKPVGFWGNADTVALEIEKQVMPKYEEIELGQEIFVKQDSFEIPQYLCQVATSYLLYRKQNNEIFVLDQHAVHERVLYERLTKNKGISAQHFLMPVQMYLYPQEIETYNNIKSEIHALGFATHIEDEQRLFITATPPYFQHASTEKFIRAALKNEDADIKQKFMDAACDAALKAHQRITEQEAIELYKQWALCEEPDFCPHGRPCYIMIDEKCLIKLFKRG